MVEGFVLPERAGGVLESVDAACGRSFQRLENQGKAEGPSGGVGQGSEEQVDVVGHDDGAVQGVLLLVVVKAMLEDELSGCVRERVTKTAAPCFW